MTGVEPVQFLDVAAAGGEGARRIAFRRLRPAKAGAPGLFWLSGFKSDMASTKATAVVEHARQNGLGATVFDYSGHGVSSGRFEDGTIGQWLDEAVEVFRCETDGPQVVIGSSMGGHIALLLLRRLSERYPEDDKRLKALVLIAPAWDMTEELIWAGMSDEARRELMETGVTYRPSDYGAPYAITRQLIEEGRQHCFGAKPFDPGRPVYILQGGEDPDVPLTHSKRLIGFLTGGHTRLETIPDGEHRLSRPGDLERLFALVDEAVGVARR